MEMQYVGLLELTYKDISNEAEKIYGLELIRGQATFKLFTKTKSLHDSWSRYLRDLTVQRDFELRYVMEKELYEKEKGVIYAFARQIDSPLRNFMIKFVDQPTLVSDVQQVSPSIHPARLRDSLDTALVQC